MLCHPPCTGMEVYAGSWYVFHEAITCTLTTLFGQVSLFERLTCRHTLCTDELHVQLNESFLFIPLLFTKKLYRETRPPTLLRFRDCRRRFLVHHKWHRK